MYRTFRLHKIRRFIISNKECGFNMAFKRHFAYPCTRVYAIIYLISILIFHIACKMFVPGVYQNMYPGTHTHTYIQQRVSFRKNIIHRKYRVIITYDVKTNAIKEF